MSKIPKVGLKAPTKIGSGNQQIIQSQQDTKINQETEKIIQQKSVIQTPTNTQTKFHFSDEAYSKIVNQDSQNPQQGEITEFDEQEKIKNKQAQKIAKLIIDSDYIPTNKKPPEAKKERLIITDDYFQMQQDLEALDQIQSQMEDIARPRQIYSVRPQQKKINFLIKNDEKAQEQLEIPSEKGDPSPNKSFKSRLIKANAYQSLISSPFQLVESIELHQTDLVITKQNYSKSIIIQQDEKELSGFQFEDRKSTEQFDDKRSLVSSISVMRKERLLKTDFSSQVQDLQQQLDLSASLFSNLNNISKISLPKQNKKKCTTSQNQFGESANESKEKQNKNVSDIKEEMFSPSPKPRKEAVIPKQFERISPLRLLSEL